MKLFNLAETGLNWFFSKSFLIANDQMYVRPAHESEKSRHGIKQQLEKQPTVGATSELVKIYLKISKCRIKGVFFWLSHYGA